MNRYTTLVIVPLLSICCLASDPLKVNKAEAKQNLLNYVTPVYPPLARAVRIQGTVHLEARVDVNGKVTSVRPISGHPMLVPAAIDAVKQWHFKEFRAEGVPVEAIADVEVEFNLGLSKEENDREEEFQQNYFPNFDLGYKEWNAGKLDDAEKHFALALDSARKGGEDKWLSVATSVNFLGNVDFSRHNFVAAEGRYRDALKIHLEHQKPDESEVGSVYGNLGYALAAQHKNEQAVESLKKAVAILKKCDSEASDLIREAKQGYRQAIARQSFMLAGLSNDLQAIKSFCQDVLTYLDAIPDGEGKENMRTACSRVQ